MIINTKLSLIEEFEKSIKLFLEQYRNLEANWSNVPDKHSIELTIMKKKDEGFDVVLCVSNQEIIVFAEGAHVHLYNERNSDDVVSSALELTYDLLTKNMRVIEYSVSEKPYKWTMQTNVNGRWETDVVTRLFTWSLFCSKKSRILQNDQLPIRENAITEKD